MRVLTGILLAALVLLPLQPALAIPFFDQLPKFTVQVAEDKPLQEWLRDELRKLRKTSSVLKTYEDPRDVARYERGSLEKLLRSRGYYAARVRESVSGGEILYRVTAGPQYRIKSLDIQMPEHLRAGFPGVPLREGDPLDAQKVLEGRKAIEKFLEEKACLLNIQVDYQATVIRSESAARLEYRVEPSPEVKVGEVRIEGLTSVDPEYLRKRVQLASGDCFNRSKIDAARLRLLRTNLIASANSEVSAPRDGVVDITFLLQERKHRTVTLGVGYTSSEGAGISAGWEHRNVLRRGEKIEIESKFNPVRQKIKGELLVPRFLRDDQNFIAKVELSNEDTDSYTSEALTLGATVTRELSKHRTASVGTELKFSQVDQTLDAEENTSENFQLLAFPIGMKWDSTDNLLDAHNGATAAVEVKPYVDLGDTNTRFVKNTLVLTGYKTAEEMRGKPTLALRIKAGVISGLSTLDIPADERFYAGGGGSVRGYAYQSLGPRVLIPSTVSGEEPTLSDPIGGRALSEISIEGRFRFNDTWGGVLFLDGGNAYLDPDPNFSDLFWGAGFGLRYMTSFAPLRLDVGFPLDRRDGVDDKSVQIYVSLGQAF